MFARSEEISAANEICMLIRKRIGTNRHHEEGLDVSNRMKKDTFAKDSCTPLHKSYEH